MKSGTGEGQEGRQREVRLLKGKSVKTVVTVWCSGVTLEGISRYLSLGV